MRLLLLLVASLRCYASQGGLRREEEAPQFFDIQTRLQMAADYTSPKLLSEYFERAGILNNLLLLKWDKNGDLVRVSEVLHLEWFPENGFNADKDWHPDNARDISARVPPSEFGRVALLLNDDVVASIDWSINPPIPFLAYTLPSTVWDNPRFHMTPTPYDMYGFNRFCITLVDTVKTPFHERKPVIIWRGETHGMSDMNRFLLIRMSAKNRDWLDARSTLKDHSLRLDRMEMSEFRYQLDIGGESGTTWGGLLWKMCSGSLIFKVDTFAKDWWHDLIEPWVHYIPVEELVSDLPERYRWVESHQEEAAKIAKAGQDLCRKISTEEYVWGFHQNKLDGIPPATQAQVKEVDDILDGTIHGSTWTFK
jgi:Glycosyl transferase family 90